MLLILKAFDGGFCDFELHTLDQARDTERWALRII